MKLLRFRVKNFRSVEDSGWIETSEVTTLIGTNESGKTNLLIPLWKLNPAKDGEINPITDYPRKNYNEIRSLEEKPVFIEAQFQINSQLISEVIEITKAKKDEVDTVSISRQFDDMYIVDFPNENKHRTIEKEIIDRNLDLMTQEVLSITNADKIEEIKEGLLTILSRIKEKLNTFNAKIGKKEVEEVRNVFSVGITKIIPQVHEDNSNEEAGKDEENEESTDLTLQENVVIPAHIKDEISRLSKTLDEIYEDFNRAFPSSFKAARQKVLNSLPRFVYYSNYGNLDSEIYLPHVIENMERDDLGTKEQAKARTLKVLFEFVNLQPQEILELGQENLTQIQLAQAKLEQSSKSQQSKPQQSTQAQQSTQVDLTEEELKKISENKKERDILLQSASTSLTRKFREWWKQGDYRFRFQADGNHFRIWVSDDRRPEDIELESRSTGLQWFLSFYLIFLVESQDSHDGAILLLDEPGLSLHPIAQRDLSRFFDNLSKNNQLLYTTHSPFMVDPDHLDRVKVVYINDKGETEASANLRAGEDKPEQTKSIYPVHAALGLSVSDILLQGCQPVIVEGTSDQIYLSAIKIYLIGKGLIQAKRELIFVPSGGIRGVSPIVSIITAKNESLPYVVLDSDSSGRDFHKKLKADLYNNAPNKIIMVGDIIGMENSEIEDLFPTDFLAHVISRQYRSPQVDDFSDSCKEGMPILPQAEEFAKQNGVKLELGWKVEIAKQAKNRLLKSNRDIFQNNPGSLKKWEDLFKSITT